MTDAGTRLWLVERTYSDDEQNLIILVYATPDGSKYLRKDRALPSFADDRPTTASITMPADALGEVNDSETRDRYATEAKRTATNYGPDEEF